MVVLHCEPERVIGAAYIEWIIDGQARGRLGGRQSVVLQTMASMTEVVQARPGSILEAVACARQKPATGLHQEQAIVVIA